MTDQEHISERHIEEGVHEHGAHRPHRHKHKYRTRERVRIKHKSSSVKKGFKKYFTYFLWSLLIALFFVSIVLLIKELNNAGILKDRRNTENIFFHQQSINNSIPKS